MSEPVHTSKRDIAASQKIANSLPDRVAGEDQNNASMDDLNPKTEKGAIQERINNDKTNNDTFKKEKDNYSFFSFGGRKYKKKTSTKKRRTTKKRISKSRKNHKK